uniref:Uncharacterized protein n=1 Tax=Anguilla anguilla TaxID=7936 RepID=A0A0E9QEN0_ANGAN
MLETSWRTSCCHCAGVSRDLTHRVMS